MAGIVKKPTPEGIWEYHILIYEYNDYHALMVGDVKPTYRIGPYPTYEDASDMYFQAYYLVKPDVDEIGRDLYWNMEIEETPLEIRYGHENNCSC